MCVQVREMAGPLGMQEQQVHDMAAQVRKIAVVQGWPEPCIYSICDRICGDFPAKIAAGIYTVKTTGGIYTVCTCQNCCGYIHCMYVGFGQHNLNE